MKPSPFDPCAIAGARPGTVLAPTVRVEETPARSRRVSCRAGSQSVWRADRPRAALSRYCYYVDASGRQHFNFTQQIWLRVQVEMAMTPVMTVALETLAVNLLTQVARERDHLAVVGVTSKRVMRLARRFCMECLLTARADGWVMPRAALRDWLDTRTRERRRARR